MRARKLLSLLLPVVVACSEDTPTPTDTKPSFAAGCAEEPTVTAEPPTATQPPNKSGSVANFLVTNNCAVSATFKMTASKSGQVTGLSLPNPTQATIGATKSLTVFLTYNTGAVGTGQVTLTAALSTNLSISSFGTLAVTVSQGVSCNLITDNRAVTIAALTRPGYLNSVTDPAFGTKITRITGDPGIAIPNAGTAVWGDTSIHNYSKDPAWNANQSLILIRGVYKRPASNGTIGWLFLDGSNYTVKYLRGHSGQARWHPTNPNIMVYVTTGGTIGNWDVPADVNTPIFTDTSGISGAKLGSGEGNLSNDGRYIVEFANRGSTPVAFALDLTTRQKFPDISISASGLAIDGDTGWPSISASGNYVVLYGKKAGTGPHCINVYTKAGALVKAIPCNYTDFIHADLTLNAAGEDIAVGLLRVGTSITASSIRLSDGLTTTLATSGSSHTSTRNLQRPGWAYITRNDPSGPLHGELHSLKLDGSGGVERLAHHRSNVTVYKTEPHGVPSPDGKRMIFASNWGSTTLPVSTFVVDVRPICP